MKIFHFITENAIHFPIILAAQSTCQQHGGRQFPLQAAAPKTSKEWPFCSIRYSVTRNCKSRNL
jgi:hypothetical protein